MLENHQSLSLSFWKKKRMKPVDPAGSPGWTQKNSATVQVNYIEQYKQKACTVAM
jgi:hypothetical protein